MSEIKKKIVGNAPRDLVQFHAGRLHGLVMAIKMNEDELQAQLADGPVESVKTTTPTLLSEMMMSINELSAIGNSSAVKWDT